MNFVALLHDIIIVNCTCLYDSVLSFYLFVTREVSLDLELSDPESDVNAIENDRCGKMEISNEVDIILEIPLMYSFPSRIYPGPLTVATL